jgi:anhydro-N-acetylmuramic acid kinase
VIALGLMSGTSLDGIDAALVEIMPHGQTYRIQARRFTCTPFAPDIERALRAALPPNAGSARDVAWLHHGVGEAFAAAALSALAGERVDYVASHGQTLFHDGDAHVTLQIGDAFVIREAVEATVCYDFRSADCAAGGHGAPLVPYVDALLFGSDREDRVAVNIGGIANLTVLARACVPVAFDTGPGNMLVDALMRSRSGGARRFDRDGACAAAGRVDEAVLQAMLADAYFARRPPKSTGRERFGEQFLDAHPALRSLSLEDAAATLTELTAATIAAAVDEARLDAPALLLSGGGAHNAHLLARLRARLPRARVERTETMGIPADAKEAIAFAVLGYETLRGRAANVPSATGATSDAVLGAIAPHRLHALLERVARECGSA